MPKRHFPGFFRGTLEVSWQTLEEERGLNLASLFAGWMLRMGTKKQGDHAIYDQADPEVDQQSEVWPERIAAVPGGRRQIGHQQKVDGISQHHRCEGDNEVSRETHSPPLDT